MIRNLGEIRVQSPFWGVNENLTVNIGNRVKIIPNYIFVGTSVKTLNLNEGLEEIGVQAFQDCENLLSITIPSSVKELGVLCFSFCSNLSEINYNAIDASASNFDIEDGCAFPFGGIGPTTLQVDKIVIGDKVEVLPACIFRKCAITEVEIPASVRKIELIDEEDESEPFCNCLNLKKIILLGPDNPTDVKLYTNIKGVQIENRY